MKKSLIILLFLINYINISAQQLTAEDITNYAGSILEKSDINKVKELKKKFEIVCNSLCSKIDSIDKRLNNIDVENES